MIYDLIIVGGGPGGIASAVEASIFKLNNVLLIEKGENHSQTIRKYYKDSKRVDKIYNKQEIDLKGNVEFFDGTKETTLEYFEELLDNDTITSIYNTEVDRVVKQDDDTFKVMTPKGEYSSKNVIVTIGRMGKPNKPSYKIPGSIKTVINHNPYDCRGSEKILVVGGGDSAVEYACQLTVDNDITLAIREEKFSRANEVNEEMVIRYDQEERLRIRYSADIESIEGFDNRVKVNYKNGFCTMYDRIIYAIGGTTPIGFLQKSGIEMDEKSHPIFDDNYETSVKGLYIAGDIVFKKGGSIAMAINHAYDVMKHIVANND
ncbi:MAG: NAD(P)-binding domain-containing protein [Ichthyobacteriaceae bacterium]|nr:NAD(P)-binding domain-containing protein [Ichthyobacteriaceae bacterium]